MIASAIKETEASRSAVVDQRGRRRRRCPRDHETRGTILLRVHGCRAGILFGRMIVTHSKVF
jgi:hypothetical protein